MSKTIPLLFALALLVGSAAACPPTPPPGEQAPAAEPTEEATVPATPWNVRYADGSGNTIRLWQDAGDGTAHFETTPVTPENSSSGTYSGGAPRSGDVDSARTDELWRHIREMQSETSIHAETRTMGSGSFSLTTPAGQTDFLVRRCPRLLTFDTWLAQLDTAP
jgi:hypothetical protein